jgi:UDP-N-acetylglucosamine 2-epimerase (non-hydrolysing)
MRNLLAEGIHPRFIHKTGSPIREVYEHYKGKIESSKILEALGLRPKEYFLVSIHRQENVDSPDRLKLVLESLESVRAEFGLPLMVSTHPRTRKRLEAMSRTDLPGITFHEPFGYLDYNKLQLGAKCVISDSGTISEESSILGFPAISLRDSIERQEALDAGTLINTGLSSSSVVRAIRLVSDTASSAQVPNGYEVGNFSTKVLFFLNSTVGVASSWKGLSSPNS